MDHTFQQNDPDRGLAVWDFDNDGDMDVIMSHVDLEATPALLRNDGGNSNHWLGLTLKGQNGPSSAVAARVTVIAGGKKQVFINQWATCYFQIMTPVFILDWDNKKIDQLEIAWTDGKNYKSITDKY